MSLSPGQKLAHYEILATIGKGGMGEVYRARDAKLERDVAIKVLPDELAENENRLARFQREAKAIAALNHPNIVTAYSVEDADDVHFITMELVEGKTLAQLLPTRGFALDKFFDIAIPLADAVAAAHGRGIVHRDLKPSNVMVTDDGRLKVLDFGLAKPTGGLSGVDVGSDLATAAKTEQGVIVGTVSYMSPEQAQGLPVDARSDVFSLGIVIFEMLSGQLPFEGETTAGVLSSIVKDEPKAINELRSGVPRELSRLARRCLAKDPSRRLQTALDVRNEIEELKKELETGELAAKAAPATRTASTYKAFVGGMGVVGLLLLLWFGGVFSRKPEPSAVRRFENPVQVTFAGGVEDFPTWSPDGQRIAYVSDQSGNEDIWVAQLADGSSVNLTEDHEGFDRAPVWSPDGSGIA